MKKLTIAPVKEMAALNANFSFADYIHYALGETESDDLLLALGRLFNPQIEKIDGRALISSIGAVERYKKYREQGQLPPQAQYWANLLLISDLFKDQSDAAAREFAASLADCWNRKIAALAPGGDQSARVIEDRDEGEIFVTLSDPATAP